MARLDERLLEKLVGRVGKPKKYVREQISKRASRQGISSEAVLILWAKELGIGTARYQHGLQPYIREEVRDTLPAFFAGERTVADSERAKEKSKRPVKRSAMLSAAIEYLLEDEELRNRCADLLKARANYDRVFREATTVLDDRLKKLSGAKKINPAELTAKVLHPSSALLRVSSDNDEQEWNQTGKNRMRRRPIAGIIRQEITGLLVSLHELPKAN